MTSTPCHLDTAFAVSAIPWLKTFVDGDARYTPFLCPNLPDPSGISLYRPKCPYLP